MSFDTHEEFSSTLSDILSSGSPFGMAQWHRQAIAELIEGMDRDSVIEHANMFYGYQDPSDLREGELGVIAELISNLDPSRPNVEAESQIVFK